MGIFFFTSALFHYLKRERKYDAMGRFGAAVGCG